MNIKAVIFDKDGTLVDFPATFTPATRKVLEELAGNDVDLLRSLASAWDFDLDTNKIADHSIIVAGSGIDITAAIAQLLGVEDIRTFAGELDQKFGAICVQTVQPLQGVEFMLQTLQTNKIKAAIGTNDAQANAEAQMNALGFDRYFERIFGADSGYGAKPGPGMVSAFVDFCGLEPQNVMMVGDSLHDLEAGRAAGVVTCGVETGPADRSDLEKHADIVLSSVTELPGYMNLSV